MDMSSFSASPFLPLIGWSVVLLIFHVLLQGFTASTEASASRGPSWNAGPRDDGFKPVGKMAGRAERASANFRETYPAFVGLALAMVASGDPGGWGIVGAWLWLACRLVYAPLYLAGIPYIRSIAWLGSVAGLLVMTAQLVF